MCHAPILAPSSSQRSRCPSSRSCVTAVVVAVKRTTSAPPAATTSAPRPIAARNADFDKLSRAGRRELRSAGRGAGRAFPLVVVTCAAGGLARTGESFSHTGESISHMGGSLARTGGSISRTGGSFAHTGESISHTGGSLARTGGSISRTGGSFAHTGREVFPYGAKVVFAPYGRLAAAHVGFHWGNCGFYFDRRLAIASHAILSSIAGVLSGRSAAMRDSVIGRPWTT